MGSVIKGTRKNTSLRGTALFDVLSVKISATVSALAYRKKPQTKKTKKKRKTEKNEKNPSKDNFTYKGVKNP